MTQIRGVHHVALGVRDLEAMKRFYIDVLGFKRVIAAMPEEEQTVMHETVRAPLGRFGGAMLQQEGGGIVVEMIRMTTPEPRPLREKPVFGDIGVAKLTVGVPDLEAVYARQKGRIPFCSQLKGAEIPHRGAYRFVYCRDPEGNLIEFISFADVGEKVSPSGARWVGVSVTDLDRSIEFYQNRLGLDVMAAEPHEAFTGLVDEVSGHTGTRVRSCLLGSSGAGPDEGMVELFEVMEPRGRSIPFSARWGDFGYLQVCFRHEDAREAASRLEKEGVELLCGHTVMVGGPPGPPGEFFYLKDPDGIPLEHLYLPF